MEKKINQEENISIEKKAEKIGGWLILVGIGILLTPIKLAFVMYKTFLPIFQDGTWETLTKEGAEAYNRYWAPLLFSEISINMGLILFSIYLIKQFFQKKINFPIIYSGFLIFNLVFIIADAFAIRIVLPKEEIFDSETIGEIVRLLVVVSIWVPYMIFSKRVKATFVEK